MTVDAWLGRSRVAATVLAVVAVPLLPQLAVAGEASDTTLADPATRPITFVFNGGPGSSAAWLHVGGLGPKRLFLQDDGGIPAPPARLVDNAQTWLRFTDLVFIDPVGTGFSRASPRAEKGAEENGRPFWG